MRGALMYTVGHVMVHRVREVSYLLSGMFDLPCWFFRHGCDVQCDMCWSTVAAPQLLACQ